DRIIAVSPTYAEEIMTAEFGYGLEGLLRHRRQVLLGILNGVDYRFWDPRHDPLIGQHYWVHSLADKQINKRQLQRELGLVENEHAVLLAHISRLTWQKGIDLILAGIQELLRNSAVQMVVLGSGEAPYEKGLQAAAQSFPGRLAVKLIYDEALAHRIQSGADILLMPSRYEPCGLTQMYSLRYGTIPVVRRTGGLADTITDSTPANLQAQTATGFCFTQAASAEFLQASRAAIASYQSGSHWRQIMQTAMLRDFTWQASAEKYVRVYLELLQKHTQPAQQLR
ncbi:MAG: Glycogen synthase, partial [Gammaproteobacteria bacterium]|nr:Glycogen synthase [Gammaproteobacteria bacterium]